MNFKNFYTKTNNRLQDSILSLWATGDDEMQQYFSAILKKEELMATPVFQNTFPWEPSKYSFEQMNSIFDEVFINSLDQINNAEYRFPKNRHPYKHQVESWETLLKTPTRSIAVTTGTGSGKTECFMLPVLYDLFKNCRNSHGINAIFLYPLNALIGSQRKRIDAWCRALSGLNYAVYNGNTFEGDRQIKEKDARKALPQLITRKQIRETPPQILFTNPSMLEYILVRNKDVELLKKSKGKLRWILLDEAHTLTGSAAAEMALLIRRVIDAFKVDKSQLRFAITSATVGSDNDAQLRNFMANLCGIPEDQITVIKGKRVLPELPKATISACDLADIRNSDTPEQFATVQKLRSDLIGPPALTLTDIGKRFNTNTAEEQLEVVDRLSERKIGGQSILPVRGHFFARGIGGVYACANPHCDEHKDFRPATALGTYTTVAGILCKCGSPLLELVACRSCGNQLIEGEKKIGKNGDEFLGLTTAVTQDAFTIDKEDEEDEDGSILKIGNKCFFTRRSAHAKFINDSRLIPFSLTAEGKIIKGETFVEATDAICPHCGEPLANPMHFRISASFVNRILSDIILEETPESDTQTEETLWRGHKYISFTDSRQGTAKIAALINQDSEATWIRSQIFHKLCETRNERKTQNPQIAEEDVLQMIAQLEEELETERFPAMRVGKQKMIDELKKGSAAGDSRSAVSLSWNTVIDYLSPLSELNTLFNTNNPNDLSQYKKRYLQAILYDQFARRLPRERSLENLGMVSIIYPKLQKSVLPKSAKNLKIDVGEWRMLLKIAVDYVIRSSFHFFVDNEIFPYTTHDIRSRAIYNPDSDQIDVKRWPTFSKNSVRVSRLVLLICAGLKHHEMSHINKTAEDDINSLLQDIWREIKGVLDTDGNGFKLKLENASEFQLTNKLWLCPVKRRLIDAHFRGYSPWIKGSLTTENIRHYEIKKTIEFPEFPYAFNRDEEKNEQLEITRKWLELEPKKLREQGVWSDMHEQIILNRPLYLSGEHSAQQNEKRLIQLEEKFEKSKINILSCSTTMEMGVDIGGISSVVMNNVPPSPANYLQRAGRAGRRSEAKSLAFTICAPNPIGLKAMQDPTWALDHKIAPPFLSFRSEAVVERHVNAFFMGKFVQTDAIKGLNVRVNVDLFFNKEEKSLATLFTNWLLSNDVLAHEVAAKIVVNGTPLSACSFSYLLQKTIRHFQELTDRTLIKKKGLEEKLVTLEKSFGADSPAVRAVSIQKAQFLEKNAIGYLAENGFLPSAGLPTGIVEFDTVGIEDLRDRDRAAQKSKPSYFITQALSEFAPGNNIVIDGKSYISEGIMLKNERGVQTEREIIQSCRHCGYQRIIEVANNTEPDESCPHCGNATFTGINFTEPSSRKSFTEMIQPAGFAVDIYQLPSRKITERSNAQYVDPLLINIKPWTSTNNALFDIRESEEMGEIVFYNKGKGNGYSVCLHCGRTAFDRTDLENHKRLRGGKNKDTTSICTGNGSGYAIHDNVVLGGRFKTDYCEIRFRDSNGKYSQNESLLYSLGVILSKELAAFLAVEGGEISFGLKHYQDFSTIFIFDTAKGGAGYCSQFSLYADKLFKIAEEKLAHCSCEKACTKCLIDRQTQWHLNTLDRKLALDWLKQIVNTQVPPQYLQLFPNLEVVHGSLKDEIGRLSYVNGIKEMWCYVSANLQSWEWEKLAFISKLKNKVKLNLVFPRNTASHLTTDDKIQLLQMGGWITIYQLSRPSKDALQTICKIVTQQADVIEYLAESIEMSLNENWGNSATGVLFKKPGDTPSDLDKIELALDNDSVFEIAINEVGPISSKAIAKEMLKGLASKVDLKKLMQHQNFEVSYHDRFLKTPFGSILLTQFINELKRSLDFTIDSFTFKGKYFTESKPEPYLLWHTFRNADDRNADLVQIATQSQISNVSALNAEIPHYRYFEFKNEKIKIIIRPDAGIEHGWSLSQHNPNIFYKQGKNIDASTLKEWDNLIMQKWDINDLLYTISIIHN